MNEGKLWLGAFKDILQPDLGLLHRLPDDGPALLSPPLATLSRVVAGGWPSCSRRQGSQSQSWKSVGPLGRHHVAGSMDRRLQRQGCLESLCSPAPEERLNRCTWATHEDFLVASVAIAT